MIQFDRLYANNGSIRSVQMLHQQFGKKGLWHGTVEIATSYSDGTATKFNINWTELLSMILRV